MAATNHLNSDDDTSHWDRAALNRPNDSTELPNNQEQPEPPPQCLERGLILVDVIGALVLAVYLSIWYFAQTSTPIPYASAIGIWLAFMLVILLARVLLAAVTVRACGLYLVAAVSSVLSVYDAILALVVVILESSIKDALSNYNWHIPGALRDIFVDHFFLVWSFLLVASVIECVRYYVYNVHYRYAVHADTQVLLNDDSPASRRQRPWWWNRKRRDDSELHERLLNNGLPEWVTAGRQTYHEQTGVTPQRWNWFRRKNSNDDNIRGDGSVDFASVQEEWASRTEEDPYWWSREENEEGSSPKANGERERAMTN